MPETRDALFVLAAGAGFFPAMYEWITMIAERCPDPASSEVGGPIGDQVGRGHGVSLFDGTGTTNGQAEARRRRSSTQSPGRRPARRATSPSAVPRLS